MSTITTVRCRAAQAFVRLGRRLHPMRKQAMETGAGAVLSVGQILRDRRLKKPLVVQGAGELAGLMKLQRTLGEADVTSTVLDDIPPSPTAADGERIADAFRQEQCDCLIALGDGELIDLVKAAAAAAVGRREILSMAGVRRLSRRGMPPVIAVPTVAGSGAEALGAAVVADESGSRVVLEDEALMPAVAVLDPELLAEAPREKVADAGFSGLCLAIEAFLAAPHGENNIHRQAAEAVELLLADLEPCWNSGGTVKQRSELLSASRMAGRAASAVGCGYARALVRAAQTVCGMDMRTACGAILPAVLEKYGSYATDGLALLAVLADVEPEGSRAQRAEALIARLRNTAFRLGLPDQVEGVTEAQAAEIADIAAAQANPRYVSPVVWTAKECHELLLSVCAPEN